MTGGNISGGGGNALGPVSGGQGQGRVSSGAGDQDAPEPVGRSSVFDPPDFQRGDEVRVDLQGLDPGEVEGRLEGEGLRNLPLAPYTDGYAEYRRQALEALDTLAIPAAQRELVMTYFTVLEP